MSEMTIKQHYNQYYYYDLPKGQKPDETVNKLFDAVMRNDKEALEQVLRILISNTYNMVHRKLERYGRTSIQNMDDALQEIQMEITRMTFRGYSSKVSKEGFYGYLIRTAENCVKKYLRETIAKTRYDCYGIDISNSSEVLKEEKSDLIEKKVLKKEDLQIQKKILEGYIQALQETKEKPFKVITYCYAVLIPQMFKKSGNPKFLKKVDKISGRKKQPPNSHYDIKNNRVTGEIARDSVILQKWALEAMHEKKLSELDEEFLELYADEPICDLKFSWGKPYQDAMMSFEQGKPMKDLVITETYHEYRIKNWPIRVAQKLLEETEQKLLSEQEFGKESIEYFSNMFSKSEKKRKQAENEREGR